jgi:hypothetical protein
MLDLPLYSRSLVMFSSLSRRWCSLLASLLMVFMDLMPLSAASVTHKFSVSVKTDCLSCAIAEHFPGLHEQLQGQVPWTASTQHFGKRRVTGFTAVATANNQAPAGLKPVEEQAWIAMAERRQMQVFLPRNYNDPTVVDQGTVRVEVQPLGAQLAKAERQGKTLVYKNAYPNTDSLQVVKSGRSEEFLYLRNKTAPTVFHYQVRVGKGVQVRSQGGSVAFVDNQGKGVRIERPWLVDSNGQRSESAVHWQILAGGRLLRLVVEPQGLRYPLVVDPSWTTTGSMSTPRSGHTATLLSNGTVLVVGGTGDSLNTLSSAEVYDPATATWSTAGSMSNPRAGHTATLLPNGQVLVVGGQARNGSAGSIFFSSAEVYDSATATWSTAGSMVVARAFHTATLLPNGKVLVVGGQGNANSGTSAELYDLSTSAWVSTGSMVVARASHTATLLGNGKVLAAGGQNADYLDSAELYDLTSGTWSATGSMVVARAFHTATLLGNEKVLIVGGFAGNASIGDAELYDPASGTWSATGSMVVARVSHTATLLPDGEVLVAGGRNFSDPALSKAELYDPTSGAWSAIRSMIAGRSGHTATLLSTGKVLAAGGPSSSAELYGVVAPAISSFSPTSAGVGSIVNLTGSGFTGVTSVSVNGLAASFGFISDNQLNLQVPSGATSGLITVTTSDGSATSTTSLTVLNNPPVITSFSPTSGPVGTTVTINGANFTGATSIRFRTAVASFTVLSGSKIEAVVPAGARSGAIVVITPNGFNTSPTKFTVTP